MPISAKQLAANRANARRSTGPRTPEGKAISSRNALTHGLCAADLVAATAKETTEEFDDLLARLTDELVPQGLCEELLVSQIAAQYWRLRRVVRAEAAAIEGAQRDALAALDRQHDPHSAIEDIIHTKDIELYGPVLAARARKLLTSSPKGVEHTLTVLRSVRVVVAERGALDPDGLHLLDVLLGEGDPLCHVAHALAAPATGTPPPSGVTITDLLAALDERITQTTVTLEAVQQQDARARSALLARHSLPPGRAADTILRYEKTIQNALYRAMHELDWLQSRRLAGDDCLA